MVDLSHWEDGEGPTTYDEPVRVRLTKFTSLLRAPGKGNKLAGYTGIDPKRGRTYITIRNSRKHYYRKGGGYAISQSILDKLQEFDIKTIVVYVNNRDRSLVFMPKQYYEGEQVPRTYTPGGDIQRYAEQAQAIETFDQTRVPITDLRR